MKIKSLLFAALAAGMCFSANAFGENDYIGLAEAPAPAKEEIKEEAKADAPAPVIEGGNKVASPLPGSVVEVLVAPGDTVKEGQPVLIIEAMKMENEIPSPFSGTVGQILVERGRFVNNGDVLMTIV